MWAAALLLSVVATGVARGSLDPGQEAAVQSVFREVLKIEPPAGPERARSRVPPRHMLELYRKYASGAGPRRATGNTVRSIVPTTGQPLSSTSPDLLLFNVSCVEQSEEVHLAQLHLHRRRLARHQHWHNRRVLAPPYRVRLYQIGPRAGSAGRTRTMPLASVPVPHATRGGWHALDITPVLRELLLNTQGQLALGVRFEAPKGRPIPTGHFLREPESNSSGASSAFLVVFSEDSPDNGLSDDDTEPRLHFPPPHTHNMAEMLHSAGGGILVAQDDLHFSDESTYDSSTPENKTDEDFYLESSDSPKRNDIDTPYRHKHKSQPFQESLQSESNSLAIDPSLYKNPKMKHNDETHGRRNSMRRHRNRSSTVQELSNQLEDSVNRRIVRSILDNELPDGQPTPTKSVLRTSPATLLTERPSVKTKGKQNIIPLPPGSSGPGKRLRGSRRRKGRGRKRGDHKKRPRHRSNEELLERVSSQENKWIPEEDKNKTLPLCQRKKLVVNFADIGWDDFVVAPAMFEAHYCAGDCRFPLSKALKPTNHATIQSLLHVTGHQPDVPAPCCVPDHLSPVSMLYLDSAENVVLKTYPSMAVDSCACR